MLVGFFSRIFILYEIQYFLLVHEFTSYNLHSPYIHLFIVNFILFFSYVRIHEFVKCSIVNFIFYSILIMPFFNPFRNHRVSCSKLPLSEHFVSFCPYLPLTSLNFFEIYPSFGRSHNFPPFRNRWFSCSKLPLSEHFVGFCPQCLSSPPTPSLCNVSSSFLEILSLRMFHCAFYNVPCLRLHNFIFYSMNLFFVFECSSVLSTMFHA